MFIYTADRIDGEHVYKNTHMCVIFYPLWLSFRQKEISYNTRRVL